MMWHKDQTLVITSTDAQVYCHCWEHQSKYYYYTPSRQTSQHYCKHASIPGRLWWP